MRSRAFVAVLLALGCLAVGPAPVRAQGPVAVEVKRRVELLRGAGPLRIGDELVRPSELLEELYERRGFAPLWSDPGRVASLVRAVAAMEAEGLRPADYHQGALSPLSAAAPTAGRAAELDLLRTDALLRMAADLRWGRVDPATVETRRDLSRPLFGDDAVGAVLSLLSTGDLAERVLALRPSHPVYAGLTAALAELRAIRDRGGWARLPAGPPLALDSLDARVPALRRRLAQEGYAASANPSPRFDPALEAAVKRFQHRHGLNEDGVVGPATLAELNVPVERRIEQVRVNLERGRWLLHGLADAFVVVNVAGQKVYFVRDGNVLLETRAVVGKPALATPLLRATLRYIDLNPTWTVPPGIVHEVLAAIRRQPGYLRSEGFRVLDRSGRSLDRSSIPFARYSGSGFPYVFRQDPGPTNPLGRLKFVFPNRYNVYLHDTPARTLFQQEQRTFSHGCIRVQQPIQLAALLLDDARWSVDSLVAAIAEGRTRTIELEHPVPVLVLYWTAAVDLHDELHFYRDVYGRDPPLLRALSQR